MIILKKYIYLYKILKQAVIVCFICFPLQILYAQTKNDRIEKVKSIKGLIAFWDFRKTDTFQVNGITTNTWSSWYDVNVMKKSFPMFLRRSDDSAYYGINSWSFKNPESTIKYDTSAPFGSSIHFNLGYIFGETPRNTFDNTPLDIHGNQAFTLVAWVKFTGNRHFITGIWDEGGWSKYSGRRQFALFGGLFGDQKGALAHISATGAASFPQSTVEGSKYARMRAIDGRDFENNEWHCLAMTFDPQNGVLTAWLDGTVTNCYANDMVYQDVYKFNQEISANPLSFNMPIFSNNQYILKFNGYDYSKEVKEIFLRINQEKSTLKLDLLPNTIKENERYYAKAYIKRKNKVIEGSQIIIPASNEVKANWQSLTFEDIITTELYRSHKDSSIKIGSTIEHLYTQGAPFTFGRALGLGNNSISHGSQLFLGGVAVFNHCLNEVELKSIAFINRKCIIKKIEAAEQTYLDSTFDQTLRVTVAKDPRIKYLLVNFREKNYLFPIQKNTLNAKLEKLAYNKTISCDFEPIIFQLLNNKKEVVEEWKGKRMFKVKNIN